MPATYSSLYSNFVRQGSTFAKSITTHGYAQSVVAATHPHVLNSQNRPVFGRRRSHRFGGFSAFQLHSAFHTERTSAGISDHRTAQNNGGLEAYFEALQSKQANGEAEKEWTQFEFPKRIEWKPSSSTVLRSENEVDAAEVSEASEALADVSEQSEAALAHIDAALKRELEARKLLEAVQDPPVRRLSSSAPISRTQSPVSETPRTEIDRIVSPDIDRQSQSYAEHLLRLSEAGRYAEIPAVFEAMLATGVKPIASAYNALFMAAIHIPTRKTEIVSKALNVYTDMIRRRISPDCETYDILVGLLASRSLEVFRMKASLEEKRQRFGGMDEPGKFMLASHELENDILCEDDRLDLAIKLFDSSVDAASAKYSAETYQQLIYACAESGRVTEMLRLFEHLERSKIIPLSSIFPAMITAFAQRGDLVSAMECYDEYRSLAIAQDGGEDTLHDRSDCDIYAAVINAYVTSDKVDGAMKFFEKIVREYGVRASDMKDALVKAGFVDGFISRGIYHEALRWAQSIEEGARAQAMTELATAAADNHDKITAVEAYNSIVAQPEALMTPTMALMAMNVRLGDVAAATKYWQILSDPQIEATSALIEPTTMYAVALIGSGRVIDGLTESDSMFSRIWAAKSDGQPDLAGQIEEGVDFIHRYMESRGIPDPREVSSVSSSVLGRQGSSFLSTSSVSSFDDNFDPYARTTDLKGSSLIANDLEGSQGRKAKLDEALRRFHNIRRAGRHPRYITYAKLISAAAREGKMDLCGKILTLARIDMPLAPQYAAVRYGWCSILDAMIGACLTSGNRGRADQYHQELREMGAAPSANTFGLFITTLKESTKTFDEATEAVRIFRMAKSEGVEPTSFLYNALIGKLGKARRIDDCLFYFGEMRALGINPTSVTYGTIVNALCRVSDEKFAEELFDEMETMPNYKARPAPYNSMMQFFLTTKRDKSKVLAYYERMRAKGIPPTSHTFKLLIDTHATLEPIDMDAAQDVLTEIRASIKPETVHYASLIHARGCVLHDMEGAQQLFDTVVRDSLVPANAILYQALFETMVANHRVEESQPVLDQMRKRGVELTPYIANTLIHGWAGQNNIAKAKEVYDAVPREKREPSTYEAITRAYLTVGQRDEAQLAVKEMLTRGYPSAVVNKVLELLGGGQEACGQ